MVIRMTNEEALNWFKDDLKYGKCLDKGPQCNAIKKAIEALERQIPKKPYKRKEGKETNYYCSCKYYLGDETEIQLIAIRPRFCDNCGQVLDWSDTNA